MKINVWNPISNKMNFISIINSFHGIYNRSVYRNDNSVYLVKNNNCNCLKYQLVSESMIGKKITIKELNDITNDIKIKFPRQTEFVNINNCDKNNCKCLIQNKEDDINVYHEITDDEIRNKLLS